MHTSLISQIFPSKKEILTTEKIILRGQELESILLIQETKLRSNRRCT